MSRDEINDTSDSLDESQGIAEQVRVVSPNKLSRISIPGRLIQLLLTDGSFFREVMSLKKASTSGSFPKYDQWCDPDGFHMEFALAGYSKKDLEVTYFGQQILIRSAKEQETSSSSPMQNIQTGAIVRCIARRNFSTNFLIEEKYDVTLTKARLKDGLLHLTIPVKNQILKSIIQISDDVNT